MRCAICDHELHTATEPIVPTTTSELVHIACADQQAHTTYQWRSCRAAISTSIAIGLLYLMTRARASVIELLILLVMLVSGHLLLNRYWWRLTISIFRLR
jgi:hypothetical protein